MKVKILKCTSGPPFGFWRFWYHDKIGQEFEIDERFHLKAEGYFYSPVFVTWVNGKEHGINPEDCEIVKEAN